MSRVDRIAILICLIAVAAAAWISVRIYEGLPHLEDEVAYTWQAKLVARGKLTVPSPEVCPKCYLVPFVIDHNGQRFGKYPLGWPVVLAAGEAANARQVVNPLLAGLAVWFSYLIGKKLFGEGTGLLTAILTATSPFFLMLSGSFLSHTWSLLLALAFTLAWLDAFHHPNPRLPVKYQRSLPMVTAALCIAVLALTRPLTAVGVALPFGLHAVYLLFRSDSGTRRRLLAFGVLAGSISALHIAWQYAVTGDPFLNPYTLWWPYDTIGFGPGVGRQEGGYTLHDAWLNIQFSISYGLSDLFGWPGISWIFMPAGILAIMAQPHLRRRVGIWLAAALLPAMVITYMLYWIGSWLYGPRYYFEGIISATLLSAAGIQWLAGRLPWNMPVHHDLFPWNGRQLVRFVLVSSTVAVLIISNILYYLPLRLNGMVGLYGVSRACYAPFESARAQAAIPALVFVRVEGKWIDYGCMIDMSSPFYDSDFVLVISRNDVINAQIAAEHPGRTVLYYDPVTQEFSSPPRAAPLQ